MKKSVAITGMGVFSSIGSNQNSFWQNLLEGVSGVKTITSFDVAEYPTKIGGEIESATLNGLFTQKERKRKSRISQMALIAAAEAIDQANLTGTRQLQEAGVIIGSSQGGFAESETLFKAGFLKNKTPALGLVKSMNSAPTTNISIHFGINGPTMSIDSACASSNHAIGIAGELIASGMIKTAIVGGVDSPFSPLVFRSWCNLRALSRNNDNPSNACKPFNHNRDGTVLGEGAGILVLEKADIAKKRGAHIYGYLAGYGTSSDAFHITMPHVDGMTSAMENALERANIELDDVQMINAHGTGTLLNDDNEAQSINNVFGKHADRIPIMGIKANVGHLLAGAGALEAISCIQSLNRHVIPPIINLEQKDRIGGLSFVANKPVEREMRYCMSNSFAFGGSNSVLVFASAA